MDQEQYACVALSRVPGIGPKLYRTLIQHFGSATEALHARPPELTALPGIAEKTVTQFSGELYRRQADNIIEFARAHGHRVLCFGHEQYPPRLLPHASAPPVLYQSGEVDLSSSRSIAIIGTRHVSERGARQAENIISDLATMQPLIVSGLAYGVDIHAHRAALAHQLPTVGVMGNGLSRIYPHQHAATARRMVAEGGGLLTEYPHWMKPERDHFPARNRIVAMLADMVLVVESDLRGGSMITAKMATESGTPLGACPGRPGDKRTAGCNYLIKSARAHLIESAGDIVALLKWKGGSIGTQRKLFGDLSPAEEAVVSSLRDQEGMDIDELRYTLSVPPSALAATLLTLEVKEIVTALPGKRYRLTG